MARDNKFTVIFDKFNLGAGPLIHLDDLSMIGNSGQYSKAINIDIISKPGILTQGPGLATLTAGTEAGAVSDLINFIIDRAVASNVTYAISDTLLHKLSATAVSNAGIWPHTITNATDGSSCIHFQGKIYYFYNKSSGADCGTYDLSTTFDDDYMSTVPTGAAALQKALHPVAKKEDIIVFGNGRYLGTFISSTTTVAPTKLDFGEDTEVADVLFHANQWHVAVNSGVTTGTNRSSSQIYLYDGSAVSTVLADEVAVGLQRIGFIMVDNGIVYVAYEDLSSSGGFTIGFISGRQIKPLRHFTGTLPTFAQKTLYKNTIAFVSSGLIYSVGAVVEQLPIQLSQHADGGFSTVGALSAPFGTPMVASTQSTSFKIAKFSGLDTSCHWESMVIPTISGRMLGYIDFITVYTNNLGSGARCDLQLEYNQAVSNSGTVKQITTTGKRRHVLSKFAAQSGGIEDFRIFLDWENGSTSNECAIKKMICEGHFVEKS